MEHAHDEASLVHQHDYRRPRRLPPLMSGTPAFAFAPHEMAWSDPALSQSASSASSASQSSSSSHYSSLASNRSDRGYELEASPSFVQPRYPPEEYTRPRDGSEMDPAFAGTIRYPPAEGSLPHSASDPHARRVGREERSQSDEGYVSYELPPIDAHARESPPAASHYYGVFRPERTSPHLRYSPYRPPHARHPDSVSLAGSEHATGSPVPSNPETEASSSNSQPYTMPAPLPTTMTLDHTVGRGKNRKTRLYSCDRRAICDFQMTHPRMRQEDIAKHFNIERSTVSKILKQKEKWLNAPSAPSALMSKYRTAKYSNVELPMEAWVKEQSAAGTVFTDAMIRTKALEVAKDVADAKDKFKASPGWVENFKARMGIRKGLYYGDGKNNLVNHTLGFNGDRLQDGDAPGRKRRVDVPTRERHLPPDEWRQPEVETDSCHRRRQEDLDRITGGPVGRTDRPGGLGALDDTDDADTMDCPEDEERSSWHGTNGIPHAIPTTQPRPPGDVGGNPSLAADSQAVLVPHPHVSQEIYATSQHISEGEGHAHVAEASAVPQLNLEPQFQEEPDYVKAIELVLELSRRSEFKRYAELRDEDDDCLVNMVQAIKAYFRGQPHRRH